MKKQELLISLKELLGESQSMHPVESNFFLANGIREVIKELENEKSSVIGELSYNININGIQEAKDHLKELESKLEYIDSFIDLVRTNSKLAEKIIEIKKPNYFEGDTRG